jgi:hypothetical protein
MALALRATAFSETKTASYTSISKLEHCIALSMFVHYEEVQNGRTWKGNIA